MSRLAVEKTASGITTNLDSSYNSSTWNLGSLIKKRTDLGTPFIGPCVVGLARPAETGAGTVNAAHYPWAMQWDISNGIDWVFLIDQNTAAATRRIHLWEFNRNTSAFAWKGFYNLVFPFVGAHTVQGFKMSYETYSKGQVTGGAAATPNLIHGWQSSSDSSTAWKNDGICVGNRIGFGTTDPTQVQTWYQIQNILGDSSLYLTTNMPSPISVSTNYVIEDLRSIILTTAPSATLWHGGLHVAKGLNYNEFTGGGTTCTSCGNLVPDSSRYVYRLAPVNALTSIAGSMSLDASGIGCVVEPKTDWKNQNLYSLQGWGAAASTFLRVFKYNVRAPLTIINGWGTSVSALSASTGIGVLSTGTPVRTNNGRFAKLGHGVFQDVSAIYFTTTTRVNAIKTADILEGSTTFIQAAEMQEKTPGTVNTFPATSALASVEYAGSVDRLIVMSSGATGFRSYVSKFYTNLEQMDHIFLLDDKQLQQSIVDSNFTPHPTTLSLFHAPWAEAGILYLTGTGATAITNFLYAIPIGAEWTFSSSTNTAGQLISPKFLTPNCNKFVRAYCIRDNYLGNDIIGKRTDALRLSYRTSGIDDNSGSWTSLTEPNDLSGAGSSSEIQLKAEFKAITDFCVPARLMVLGVVYDDTATDSHFRLSQVNSNITTKTFAWRFVTSFDSSVPALKVVLYDDVANSPLVTDYTDVSTGTWQKSYNDGGAWQTYDSADLAAGNSTTYIRYTPTALADNTKVRAMLTLK